MREHIITSAAFFQSALYANSRDMTPELAETLLLLSTRHLFGLYNPNQVAEALSISKNRLYRDLKDMSLYHRCRAKSPTFGELVRLFFSTHGKTQTMMVFGKPLRATEILHIWSQHHGIEQFWRHLKTDLRLSAMSLHHRNGAYGTLGIKIINYLMIQQVSRSTHLTFHQIKLQLSGDRQMFSIISAHFHERNAQQHL